MLGVIVCKLLILYVSHVKLFVFCLYFPFGSFSVYYMQKVLSIQPLGPSLHRKKTDQTFEWSPLLTCGQCGAL